MGFLMPTGVAGATCCILFILTFRAYASQDNTMVCVKTRNLESHEVHLTYYKPYQATKRILKYKDSLRKHVRQAQHPDLCARAKIEPKNSHEQEYQCVALTYHDTKYTRYRLLSKEEAVFLAHTYAWDNRKDVRYLNVDSTCENNKTDVTPWFESKPRRFND